MDYDQVLSTAESFVRRSGEDRDDVRTKNSQLQQRVNGLLEVSMENEKHVSLHQYKGSLPVVLAEEGGVMVLWHPLSSVT